MACGSTADCLWRSLRAPVVVPYGLLNGLPSSACSVQGP